MANLVNPQCPPEELLSRARSLIPLLADRAAEIERIRKLPDDVLNLLVEAEFFKIFVPRRFRGFEYDLDTFLEVTLALAESCTSTACLTSFFMAHNWIFAHFDLEVQSEILGENGFALAPFVFPSFGRPGYSAEIQREAGGYRLTGRWAYASGIMHAGWVILSGFIRNDQNAELLFCIVKRDDVSVRETWDSAGMQGTGSHDIICDNVFVPENRVSKLDGVKSGKGLATNIYQSPIFRIPFPYINALAVAGSMVGTARGAVNLHLQRLTRRVQNTPKKRFIYKSQFQIGLGRLEAEQQRIESAIRKAAVDLQGLSNLDNIASNCNNIKRIRIHTEISYAGNVARQIVREVVDSSGAGAHMKTDPLQRMLRDVDTMGNNVFLNFDDVCENFGRVLIGMEPRIDYSLVFF